MIPIGSREVMAEIGRHHAQLAALYARLSEQDWDRDPGADRVLTLREAAVRIGASVSWLSRRENYLKVGGYLDVDRRLKFADSALRRHLEEVASGGDR